MTTNHHTQIAFNADADSSVFNAPLSQLDSAITNLAAGDEPFGILNIGAPVLNTIDASGNITLAYSHTALAPNSGLTDDLETILGGTSGDLVVLRTYSATDVITIKHDVGNIFLKNAADIIITSQDQSLALVYNGTYWTDISGGDSGAVDIMAVRAFL